MNSAWCCAILAHSFESGFVGPGWNSYIGINDVYAVESQLLPTGKLMVEVQYHTEASIAQAEAQHDLFVIFRSGDPEQRMKAYRLMLDDNHAVPRPAGALELPDSLNRKPLSKKWFLSGKVQARKEDLPRGGLEQLEAREPIFELAEE